MKITILDGQTLNPGDLSWETLHTLGTVGLYGHTTEETVLKRSLDADILIVNKVVLDAETISRLPNLKFIAVTATGFNNIDITACNERGIPVSNVSNYGSNTVAQHVFALLLALTNRAETHAGLVREGQWKKSGAFSFWQAPLVELAGKTMGIIGYGNIGKSVASIANGFGMNVLYHSSSGQSGDPGTAVDLQTLLHRSDVITLHTHLHEGNRKMVDTNFLHNMRPTSYLINTARGGLVNETDLYMALKENIIAGAGLDVLSKEPADNDHPLIHLDNCIVTPHNAWASVEARQRLLNAVVENVKAFIKGRPINLVD